MKKFDGEASVIIVNWNGRSFLPLCLEALRRQTWTRFRIILVDNGSSDGSVDFVRRAYPEVDLIALAKNDGFARANNVALEKIDTEYVALLNNDAIPCKEWLGYLIDGLRRHPDAGFAASKMVFFHVPDVIDRVGDDFTSAGVAKLRGRGCASSDFVEEEWVFGACAGAALYRREMIDAIGGFDEDFFLIQEDVDLSFRAQLQGFRCIYIPEAVVSHLSSATIHRDSAVSVYYGHRNLEWVYLKNLPTRLIFETLPFHVLYILASLAFFLLNGQVKWFLKAKIDAAKGLKKLFEKRYSIQQNRVVNQRYLRGLLVKERFRDRLNIRSAK